MAEAQHSRARPKYLSAAAILFEIRLPLPGWVSILHRVSGLLLTGVCLWLALLLDRSLSSKHGFDAVAATLSSVPGRLALLIVFWAFIHHFLAGMRFLALDLGKGVDLRHARSSSAMVLALGLFCTAVIGWRLSV